MKSVIRWIIILVVVGAIGYGVWYVRSQQSAQTAQSTTALAEQITVGRGNIIASIAPTGEVYSPQSGNLSFRSAATITELDAKAGQTVKKGDVLARIDTSSLQRAVDAAQATFQSAETALHDAQQTASDLDIQKAKLAVSNAELSLESAKQAKEDLLNPDLTALEQAVQDAQYNLQVAQVNLQMAQISTTATKAVRDAQYAVAWNERNVRDVNAQNPGGGSSGTPASDQTNAPPSPGGGGRDRNQPMTPAEAAQALADAQQALAVAQAQASSALDTANESVSQARAALATAQKDLADAKAGVTAAQTAAADNTIAQAQFALMKAQNDLQTMLAGPDANTLQLAQAKYDSAKATLTAAQQALNGATLVAPYDATVMAVNAQVGDKVSSGATIVSLADLTDLEVMASIDETQITAVKVGQTAQITFDALPGKKFTGKVLEIPVQGTLTQNVVIYSVPLSLQSSAGPQALNGLRPGMTANISIETASKQNVLRLPAYAVEQGTGGTTVTLLDPSTGTTQSVPVETGITDGAYVEIVAGLNEGDVVVAQYQSASQQQNQFRVGGGGGILGGIQIFRGR